MNPDIIKLLNELKTNITTQSSLTEIEDLDKSFRELKTELLIKNEQVSQLRKDLEASNAKNQDLTLQLEKATRTMQENACNLNLAVNKMRQTDDQLREIKNAFLIQNMHYKMVEAEAKALKETNQKISRENSEFSRKLEVFATKSKCEGVLREQITGSKNKIEASMAEIKCLMDKVANEHDSMRKLGNDVEKTKEEITREKSAAEEVQRIASERDNLEKLYIESQAKFEKLEELLKPNASSFASATFVELILGKWHESQKNYETSMTVRNDTLEKLGNELKNEKIANEKLILENEKLRDDCQKHASEVALIKIEKTGPEQEFSRIKNRAADKKRASLAAEKRFESFEREKSGLDVAAGKSDAYESKCEAVLREQITGSKNKIEASMAEIKCLMDKVANEHDSMRKLGNDVEKTKEDITREKSAAEEVQRIASERDNLEKLYIESQAKFEKLEELLKPNASSFASATFVELILGKWRESQKKYKSQKRYVEKIKQRLKERENRE
ncbi:unnamed protein product [Brassicogethes aeneus]|uniref:Uncharacterized protein n=1 Tax=Brassicogethes aeneus TaxID=1431903 RepID=A0A9P0FNY5_BRAAE|nr:unnamed protein product [Brassicogethes aeneus]